MNVWYVWVVVGSSLYFLSVLNCFQSSLSIIKIYNNNRRCCLKLEMFIKFNTLDVCNLHEPFFLDIVLKKNPNHSIDVKQQILKKHTNELYIIAVTISVRIVLR